MEKYGQMTKIAIDTSQMFMQNPNALKPETQKSIIGYMLVSQIEAVEAIQELNKQSTDMNQAWNRLENIVQMLSQKFSLLEDQVASIQSSSRKDSSLALDAKGGVNSSTSIVPSENCKSLPLESTPILSLAQLCSQLHELEIEKDKFVASEPLQGQAVKPALANETSTLGASSLSTVPSKIEAMKDEKDLKNNIPLSSYPRCSHCKCLCCERRLMFGPDGTSTFWNNQPSFFDCSVAEKQRLLEDYKELQRIFNKRVKYEVNKRFGASYLATHQVRELDFKEMLKIKKRTVKALAPFTIPVKIAWSNAMNSLRQDRHQLIKRNRALSKRNSASSNQSKK